MLRSPDITITVRPIRAGRFEARHAGRVLVAASTEPFCAAARALLAEGFPPGSVLGMKHQGEQDIALRGKLGTVAKLTMKETPHGPRAIRWKAPQSAPDRALVSFSDRGLPDKGVATPKRLRAGGVR
jgi:hypothetical protein